MKKLVSLIRATMSQDMSLFRYKSKQNNSRLNKMLLPIILAIIVMFSIGTYAFMLAEPLAQLHLTYIVLTLFIIITSVITIIEGIYKSQGILFEAKDNDLLFSLPIPKRRIFFTRILKLIVFQFLYNSLFMIPAFVVYVRYENPNVSFYILSLLMLFLLPIIPTILSSIIGYIIKGVSSRFKAKKAIQVILTSIIFVVIFFVSFNIQNLINDLVKNASSINDILMKIYYPAGLYINLIQNFNILNLIILLAINIVPAIIFIYIASIFYFKITSESSEHSSNKKIKRKGLTNKIFKVKSPMSALISKEFKRFFSSPVFIINASFGIILILVITIAMSVNFEGIINGITQGEDLGIPIDEIIKNMPKIFYGLVVFTSCMTFITSSMISLEGKSFNITKSLPISTQKILLAKVLTSNIISIPIILISDIIFFVVFKIQILDIVFILLASIIMPTFTALIGLLINLKYPKMNATSDTEVVKQSMSTTISVFLGMAIGIILIGVLFIGNGIYTNLFIIVELLLFSVMCIVLWKILKSYGVKKFKEINI